MSTATATETIIDGSDTEATLAAIGVRIGQPPSAENR